MITAAMAQRLRWIGALGIVVIAVMRCCIVFVPQQVFDTDPAVDMVPIAAMGMGGSLALDAILLAAGAIALLGEWRSGRGFDRLLVGLAVAPAPVVLWHGWQDAGDMWRGSTWLAAAIASVTIAHLVRDRTMRLMLTSALLAVIVPLLARGATQMTWEHDATIAAYEQTREDFLRMRGWEPDSPAARIYERRLKHREPIGWFPSTNIYASVMGWAAIVLAGMTAIAYRAYRRHAMQSGGWFLLAILALMCCAGLRFTTSMGGMLAALAGALMLSVAVPLIWRDNSVSLSNQKTPGPAVAPRWLGALGLTLVLGASIGVIVRGSVLPEGFLGDKSLLFRWHYLQAASGILADHWLLGVGPDGIQPAYTMHRPPRNPEEIISAHSMSVDWMLTLGMAGAAWIAMLAVMLWRSSRDRELSAGVAATDHDAPRAMPWASAVAMVSIGPAVVIEWSALGGADVFVRILIVAGVASMTAFACGVLAHATDAAMRALAIAAAVAVMVHGQIDMSFFHGGSVVWMMAVTGLLGGVRSAKQSGLGFLAALIPLALATWVGLTAATPALRQGAAMRTAAEALVPVREDSSLETTLRLRQLAADRLVAAHALWPINVQPLNAAAEQLLFAAGASGTTPALGLLMRAEDAVERAIAEHDKPSSIAIAMNVHASLAAWSGDAERWHRAIALGRRMTDIDPMGVAAWRRLGDVLWAAGAQADAAQAYRRALANSDQFDLDELKQLSAERRRELESRITQAEATTR